MKKTKANKKQASLGVRLQLSERFTRKQIASFLPRGVLWRPFPAIGERQAWEGVPSEIRTALVASGEAALKAEWPVLPATLYLEFARNGDRKKYETPYFTRRHLTVCRAFAECVEAKGRFLDAVADAVWSICEESTWCLPAHISAQKRGSGLPDVDEPIPDLFAGDTVALLAWVDYLLGDRLDTVSPLLRPRIRREAKERVLRPCLEREDFWWMGLRPNAHVNNWNPWICSNWLMAALLLEEDAGCRVAAVAKIMRCLDAFIKGYPDDGGCDEGPGYWAAAGASLFECLEILRSATEGKIDVFNDPLIADMGRYIYRVHVGGPWFVNFADASALCRPPAGIVYRYGRAIDDRKMMEFGSWLAAESKGRWSGGGNSHRLLSDLFWNAGLAETPLRPPMPRDVWLPDSQIAIARSQDGNAEGWFLAAKGGHNAESHNHNDVGNFVIFRDANPVVIDVGVETYSRKTFSPQRYEIWTMQSQYHNLPTIGGVQQKDGKEFAARKAKHQADEAQASFELDITRAYPAEAGLVSWIRRWTIDRSGPIIVEDSYELAKPVGELFLSLMTPCKVQSKGKGVLELAEAQLPDNRRTGSAIIRFDSSVSEATVEEIEILDGNLKRVWGDNVRRLVLRTTRPPLQGTIRVEVNAK
jgi:hypothetical protein